MVGRGPFVLGAGAAAGIVAGIVLRRSAIGPASASRDVDYMRMRNV